MPFFSLGFVFVWLIFRNWYILCFGIAIAYPSVTMSQGLGLRAGVIDGAISISAVQVLLLKPPLPFYLLFQEIEKSFV